MNFPDESEMAPSKSHQVGPNFTTELSPASIREYDAVTGGDQLNNADEFVGDDSMESKRRCLLVLDLAVYMSKIILLTFIFN